MCVNRGVVEKERQADGGASKDAKEEEKDCDEGDCVSGLEKLIASERRETGVWPRGEKDQRCCISVFVAMAARWGRLE